MIKASVSRASLGRVSLYYKYIEKLPAEVTTVSAALIAKNLGLGEVTVRKDLAALCGNGRPKIGYYKDQLKSKLADYLDNDSGGTIIVGAGKLGVALLNYKGFEEYGLDILAAFDHHPENKDKYENKKIHHTSELKEYCRNHNVKIAIITVPDNAAQEVFDELYACGIRLFLCFSASSYLRVPEDAFVQYENMALSLAHLKQHSFAK